MPKATTLLDVIVGEAGGRTPEQRYRDMLGIASVIHNRAAATGVSPQNVVANRREFNAYGKRLPSGTQSLKGLAKKAWDQVRTIGPIHGATFYATPAATRNLPKGLQRVDATEKGHVYFTDPKNRAIGTAVGYRPVKPVTQSPFDAVLSQNTPVPVSRPVQADPMERLQRNREIGLLGMEATNSQPMRGLRADLNAQRMSMEPVDLQPINDPMDGLRSGLLAQREQFEARPTEISRNPFDTMQSEPQAMAKTGRLAPSLASFEEEARQQTARNRLAAGLREQRGLLQSNAPISGLLSEAANPVGFDQRFAGPVQTQPQASAGLGTNGLPESAPMGTVVQGQDGQNYQYVEATGMQGATSPGTWSRVNGLGPTNTAINVVSPDERTMVDRQRAFLSSQPLNSNTGARLLSGAKGLAGGFGGALLGGALLGPVGGLLGGLVGRQMTTGGLLNRYPDAPQGKTQGDGKETEYGREVRQSSKQYDRAAKSKSVGLY